jgi:signal transduction histidine kinase
MFLIADIISISIILHIERKDTDHDLKNESIQVSKIIRDQGHFPDIPPTYSIKVLEPSNIIDEYYKDTILFNPEDKIMEEFREYGYSKMINGTNYLIVHRLWSDNFIEESLEITPVISLVLIFIFIGIIIYTRIISKKLWCTFEQNLGTLKDFSLSNSAKLELTNTDIDEFDDLNEVLTKMSDRLKLDYQASQEFSSNAAHEFQTPLAIIRNKCENLFSNSDLDEDTIQSIRVIYTSTDRLSGITKALLLLAKIDHGLFQNKETISFNKIIKDWLLSFEDILQDQDINIEISENHQLKCNMDERLTNLLIQNLLTNAIKNCPLKKEIHIEINKDNFSISNYGDTAIHQPERLFERFYKENRLNNSSGIGLAIVKKIIDYSNFTIEYSFNHFKHTFTVKLNDC